MRYQKRGSLKEKKVKGNLRWVDTWKENGSKRTHVLNTKEVESLKNPEPEKEQSSDKDVESAFPSFNKDGKAIEIFGDIVSFNYTNDGDVNVTIQSEDAKSQQTCKIYSKTLLGTLFQRSGIKGFTWEQFFENSKIRTRIIDEMMEKLPSMLYRIDMETHEEPVLFAVLTPRWKKIKITDMLDILKQAETTLKAEELEIVESDGLHGGTAHLKFNSASNDVFQTNVLVTAGLLNGLSSVRVWGEIHVLSCQNQLTAAVSEKIRPLVGDGFVLRKVHAGNPLDLLIAIEKAMENVQKLYKSWDVSKQIKLTEDYAETILEFYANRAVISKRTSKNIIKLYKDPEIAQQPDSVWGLAMAISWLGTHGDVKDGVKASLKSLAGEIISVTPYWNDYKQLVSA